MLVWVLKLGVYPGIIYFWQTCKKKCFKLKTSGAKHVHCILLSARLKLQVFNRPPLRSVPCWLWLLWRYKWISAGGSASDLGWRRKRGVWQWLMSWQKHRQRTLRGPSSPLSVNRHVGPQHNSKATKFNHRHVNYLLEKNPLLVHESRSKLKCCITSQEGNEIHLCGSSKINPPLSGWLMEKHLSLPLASHSETSNKPRWPLLPQVCWEDGRLVNCLGVTWVFRLQCSLLTRKWSNGRPEDTRLWDRDKQPCVRPRFQPKLLDIWPARHYKHCIFVFSLHIRHISR